MIVWPNWKHSLARCCRGQGRETEFYACAGSALATELHWGAFSKSEFQANLAQSGTAFLEVQVIGAGMVPMWQNLSIKRHVVAAAEIESRILAHWPNYASSLAKLSFK